MDPLHGMTVLVEINCISPIKGTCSLTTYLIEMPFNAFANRADPDQAALARAARSGSTLFASGYMIYLILH